jgi:hypothetical protein
MAVTTFLGMVPFVGLLLNAEFPDHHHGYKAMEYSIGGGVALPFFLPSFGQCPTLHHQCQSSRNDLLCLWNQSG